MIGGETVLRLYGKYVSIHLRSIMQYKMSFLLTTIGQFLVSFNVFLGIFFMFQRFRFVAGFSYAEVLLCFGIMLMEFSLAEAFARGFDTFPTMLANGEFDRILVRPRNEIFQVLASKLELSRAGRFIQAPVMFVYGMIVAEVEWTLMRVFTVLSMLIGGTLVFTGIFLIYAAVSFFTLEGLEFMNVLTDGAREYGKYPVSIYGKSVLKFCTFVIPYALIQYYPLLFVLGRSDDLFYPFLPLVAGLFLIPCLLLWKLGVRHYKSTGS